MDYTPDYIRIAVEAAKKSGNILRRYFSQNLEARFKDQNKRDLVSPADLASEQAIKEILPPEHNFLMEEGGYVDNRSEYTWIIDPLDGTANFLRKIPFFSISIALVRNHEVILGVVYNPILEELYIAEKGAGATLNGEKIRVSGTKTVFESLIVQSLDTNNEKRADNLKNMQKIFFDAQDIRIFNACALSLCYIASGRSEAAIISGANLWDIAAGTLLVEEAGGQITRFDGSPWRLEEARVIASNRLIHSELIGLINQIS